MDNASMGLFTVRADDSGFRVMTETAKDALIHMQRLHELGYEEAHVIDPLGNRFDTAALETLWTAQPAPAAHASSDPCPTLPST